MINYFRRKKTTKKRTANNLKELEEFKESMNFVLTKEDYGTFNKIKRIIDKDNLSTHDRAIWVMAIMKAR